MQLLSLLLLFLTCTAQDLYCRSCGEHLFPGPSHVHGTVLSGPRVSSVALLHTLGANGTVHRLRRPAPGSGAGPAPPSPPTVDVAVYSSATNHVEGQSHKTSLFPGFDQSKVACSRCSAVVGWHFVRQQLGGEAAAPAPALPEAAVAAAAAAAALPAHGVVPYLEEEVAARLQHLSVAPCLSYPNPGGWWTYTFCHGVKVEQYHESTRWSMGTFADQGRVSGEGQAGAEEGAGASLRPHFSPLSHAHAPPHTHPPPPSPCALQKERLTPSASMLQRGYYTSHFYTNGQHCDETGKGRATEVQFYCCSSSSEGSGLAAAGRGSQPYILSLTEPGGEGTCKYVLSVCVPALCAEHPMAKAVSAALVAGQGGGEPTPAAPAPTPQQQQQQQRSIEHRELTPPSEAYQEGAMPEDFYAAALSAVVSEQEVREVAGGAWGATGGPVQFR